MPALSPLPLRLKDDGYGVLLHVILGQQVSVASAAAVWTKLQAADLHTEAAMATTTPEILREHGVSRQKARYAIGLAQAQIDYAGLRAMDNFTVIKTLCAVPGIGPWTAEVYAMYSLGRADVFAPGDLALQEAAKVMFALPARPSTCELAVMAERWSPWRSVAARIFWAYYADIKQRDGIL